MREYLLSIIIPTKNRQFYCKAAIKQILKALSGSVEIVIQDNSDDRSIEDFIGTLDAKNIIYNHHDGVLSFVDNFSEAVSLCHGEYVCFIVIAAFALFEWRLGMYPASRVVRHCLRLPYCHSTPADAKPMLPAY
jgi:hypothetical protein